MEIKWQIERLDEGEAQDPREGCCLLKMMGTIREDGEKAGSLEAYYILDDDLISKAAFWELWDMEAETEKIFAEIKKPKKLEFREPLPRLLEERPGMLIIDYIALFPAMRKAGFGREVMRQVIRCCADENIGAVLVNAVPLQHQDGAYDYFDEEVRDLPWDGKAEDATRLRKHLRSWGLHHMADTRFMVAPPATLSERHAAKWPPGPIH